MRTFTQKVAFALIALMCFAMPQVVMAQDCVDIGEGTTAVNGNVPVASWYHNSYTQQLYTADEISHAAGNITSISFKYVSGATAMTRRISIYMANTDAANLSTAYVTSGFEEVLSSSVVTFDDSNEWITLDLTTPFAYDGTSNLVVAVWQDHDASVETGYSSGSRFVQTSMTGMARYQQVDASPYTLSDGVPTTGTGSTLGARANIQLCISGGSAGPTCDKPESVEANDVTANSATINWIGTASAYNLQYKASTDADWTLVKNLSATSYALSNLASNTAYQVQVQAICGENTSGWKSVSFSTLIGLPYAEHFNASSIPSGWTQLSGKLNADGSFDNTKTSSYSWVFGASNGVFDSHAKLNICGATTNKLLVLPAIPIPEMEEGDPGFQMYFNLALTYWSGTLVEVTKGSQQDDRFIVLVSNDNGANWSTLREWNNSGSEYVYDDIACSAEGEEVAPIDLSAYAGQTIQLAFYGESSAAGGDNNLHIDDVVVEKTPTCFKPTDLHAIDGAATSTTLPVAWTANSEETAWRLQYKPTADAEAAWTTLDIAQNPYTITGLNAFTEYEVRVAAVCAADDETDYGKSIIAKTAAVVPFFQTFDTTSMPGEWKRYEVLLEDVENSHAPLVATNDGWKVGAKNGVFNNEHLYLNIAGTNTDYWLVSPVIEMLAGYQLSFDLALTTNAGSTPTAVKAGEQNDDQFIVFISTDGGANWTALGTWGNGGQGSSFDQINTEGQTVKFDLSAYAGQSIMLAFYGESTGDPTDDRYKGNNNLHISNVAIDLIPACERPLSITLGTITGTTAEITWDADEDGTWEYGVKANPAADFAPAEADYTGTTDEKLAELSELDETTDYVFFVRRACSASEKSEPLMKAFKTLQTPATLPYDGNFEETNGWLLINGDLENKWAWGTATAKTGTHALYISNDMGLSHAYTYTSQVMVYATKTFYFDETGMYSFSFDWKGAADSYHYDYMRVALAPISVDPEAATAVPSGFSRTALPEGWIALDGGTGLDGAADWQNQLAEINIEHVGNYKVIIAWRNNTTYDCVTPAAIDNFKISRIACTRPTGLQVSNITTTGASFAWNDETDGMKWVYACVPATEPEPADDAFLPVEQNSLELTGLDYNTAYVFYLRKNCVADGLSDSRTVAFKTLNPYLVVINSGATSTTNYVPFNGYYADEANLCQFVIPADSLLRMEWDTITQLTFYTSSSYANVSWPDAQFEVYMAEASATTLSGLADWDAMTLVKNAANLSVVDQEMVVTLTQPYVYQGGHLLIGFKQTVPSTGYAYAYFYAKSTTGAAYSVYGTSAFSDVRNYLPKVAMDIIPGDAPACAKPGNLVAIDSTATTTSIELDWVPVSTEEAWFVQYKKSADTEWSYATDSVKAHPFVLGGLEPSSYYDVRVAAWCDLEDSVASDYSAVVTFQTKCVSVTSLDENFDDMQGVTSGNVLPICWNYINTCTYSSYAYYPTVYAGATYANSGVNSLKFYSYFYNSTTNYDPQDQYAILPEIENVSSLRMKFNARKYSASYDATFTVGIMSDPADTATFVPVDTLAPTAATYEPFIVPFNTYVGAGKYIAIKMKAADIVSSGSSYRSVYIDDVVVEEIPSCLEPKDLMVVDTTITINSAVFKWTVQGSETEWIFQYKKHADEEWTSVPALRADSFLLTGLEASTVYDAKVAAKCGDTDISPNTDVISFTTECEPWSITDKGDYIEGFEAYEGVGYSANGVTPLCWETDGTSTYAKPHVVAKGQYAYVHDGNQSLNFCASSSSYQYAVLPEFAEPLNMLQISFWTQMESTSNGTLYLGYVDSEANIHQLTSYESANSMTNYESMLDTVPAEAVRLVFLWNHTGSSYYSCCIDDIKVSFIPSCLKPNTVSVDSVSAHLAKISWKAGEEGQAAWQIAYDTIASNQPDTLANVIDVTDSVYVANGLLAEKKYYAYVRTSCEGVYSEWTNAVSFTTLVACPAPTHLEAELTDGNGTIATLKWKAGREETAWQVEYSLNEDMTDSIAIEVADTMYNFEGLTPETTYYARVKADCGDIEGESLYSAIISFKPTNALSKTICNGTTTNSYVPVYGLYVDDYSMSQFVVPADSLASLQWGTIDGLTFYASQANVAWNSAKFEVYVAEVPSTTISAFADWASLEKVMNEAHLQIANNKLVIAFDAPYIYQGGNLLIGIKETVYGTYGSSDWYGVTATGASYGGYLSKTGTTPSASQRNFLPKMTISYMAGSAPECMFVNNVQVEATTATSATIGWTAEEGQNAWQLVYSTDAAFDPNEVTPVDAASNPYALGGLTAETSYTVYVRANCGEDGFSAWSKAMTFTTASACQMPDALEATDITTNSAVISWNTYGQTGFNLRYSADAQNWTVIENAEMPYTITGLTAATKYYVQAQVTCGDAAQWSQYVAFKTAYEAPFYEPFATSLPEDWSMYTGWKDSIMIGHAELVSATSGWNFGTNNGVFDNHARTNVYGASWNKWLVTPSIHNGGNNQLTFDLALTAYSGTGAASGTREDDKFAVLISTNGGATWAVLREWNNSGSEYVFNNIPTAGQEVTIYLNDYVDQDVMIGFYAESSVTGNGDNNLHIDNVRIEAVPSCIKPTGLTVSDVFARSAKLSWTAGAAEQNAWDIALDTIAAFNPDTLSTVFTVNENPYTLTNLLPSHTYYVYVRANCGDEDGNSVWTDKKSFKTTISCPAPNGLEAHLTMGNGSIATLTWIAAEASEWTVQYALDENFEDSIEVVVNEASIDLTGLTAEATYYARVKANCDEDASSAWSTVISFVPTDIYSMTINNGTVTNSYVPIYGTYVDEGNTASQFVVPAETLQDLLWDSISGLTFYSGNASVNWGAAEFEVYMAMTEDATLAALEDWDNMTQVMIAGNLSIADNKMVVTFNEKFQYQGDNLLIGFKQTVAGSYSGCSWYGITAQGASIGGYGSGNNMTQRNFLPKMTVNYVPGDAPACMWATHLNVSDITAEGATIAWDAVEGANWEYAALPAGEEPVAFSTAASNPLVLDNLFENTSYVFYLRNNCGDENSKVVSIAFKTNEDIENIPYQTEFADAAAWKLVNSDNAWTFDGCLFISNDGTNYGYDDEAASVSYATKLFDFAQAGDYTFTYFWKAVGENDDEDGAIDFLRVALIPAEVELTAGVAPEGLTAENLPAGWIALDGGEALVANDIITRHDAMVSVPAGHYRVAFIWINDDSFTDGDPAQINCLYIKSGDATGIEAGAGIENQAIKFIMNDQVYILLNGTVYNITGQKVEMK